MSVFVLRRILTLVVTLFAASLIIFLVLDALPGNAAQMLMGADAAPDAVRALTLGPHAQALLGHPAGYFVTRASIWALVIVAVSLPIAVARYRRG